MKKLVENTVIEVGLRRSQLKCAEEWMAAEAAEAAKEANEANEAHKVRERVKPETISLAVGMAFTSFFYLIDLDDDSTQYLLIDIGDDTSSIVGMRKRSRAQEMEVA